MWQSGHDFSVARNVLKQAWSNVVQQETTFNTQYGQVERGRALGRISAFISHGLHPYYTPPSQGVLWGTREGQIHLQTQFDLYQRPVLDCKGGWLSITTPPRMA